MGTFKPKPHHDSSHEGHGQRLEDRRKKNLQMLSHNIHNAHSHKNEKNLEKSQFIDENPIESDKKTEEIDVFDTKQKIKMYVCLLSHIRQLR
jgi:hypothetical protein